MNTYIGLVALTILLLALVWLIFLNRKLSLTNRTLRKRLIKLKRSNKVLNRQVLHATYTVQENERKRISMDLHDEIGAGLISLKYNIQAFFMRKKAGFDDQEPRSMSPGGDIFNTIDEIIRRSKDIIYDISPTTLEQCGLEAALQSMFRRTNNTYTVIASLSVEGEAKRLTTHQELMIYRVIQELLSNTMKYSDGWRFTVRLRWLRDAVEFQVNDGIMLSAEHPTDTMGLSNIQNRVLSLGGKIQKETAFKGNYFTITIPYEARKN
jgi:signal transduction histidine kinase